VDWPDLDAPAQALPVDHPQLTAHHHPILDGTPCDKRGNDLPPDTPPLPRNNINDFTPFANQAEFEFTEFLFSKAEMSASKLDDLAHLLAAVYPDQDPPYANHEELYSIIDSIPHGDVPWKSITVSYDGEIPEGVEVPSWKSASYEVWYRDPLSVMEQQIANPDFCGSMDFAPKQVFDDQNKRQYSDLMSGNWAWNHAVHPIFLCIHLATHLHRAGQTH
jgi:hypothetical protein